MPVCTTSQQKPPGSLLLTIPKNGVIKGTDRMIMGFPEGPEGSTNEVIPEGRSYCGSVL